MVLFCQALYKLRNSNPCLELVCKSAARVWALMNAFTALPTIAHVNLTFLKYHATIVYSLLMSTQLYQIAYDLNKMFAKISLDCKEGQAEQGH